MAVNHRGPYKLPERMRTIQEIRRLLIEGYTYNDIMQQLHLSPRTFYRYLSAVFADDRRLLAENISDEEMLNQMAICRDRLLKQRRDIIEQIINNPEADNKARVAAHHLAAEIAAAVFRIHTEGPAMLASRHNFPRTSLTTAAGTTGIKLVLKKKNEGLAEKEEEYDKLDEEDEEEEKEREYNKKKHQQQQQD